MKTPAFVATALSVVCAFGTVLAPCRAQDDQETVERLRRDQDEILRKAERLQALMQRLQQRYEREGKKEQVRLLEEGQRHLERSGILADAASIRDDLAAAALTEAVRKQKEVVDDLERLLNILLERKSVEQLDQQVKLAAEQAASARELEQRQRELIEATRNAVRNEPTPAQKALLDRLSELQAAQRREAERNAREAGTRRPFLESALERVRALLREQDRLETSAAEEQNGHTDSSREREFDLGSLAQRARELERQLGDQQAQDALAEAARQLDDAAAGNDAQSLQQARDRLDALLQDAPNLPGGAEGPARDPKWRELRERLTKAPAGATPAERAELQQIAKDAESVGKDRGAEAGKRNTGDANRLADDGRKLAETMRGAEATPTQGEPASAAVEDAAKKLDEAADAGKTGDTNTARERVNQATAALERARSLHRQQNPDAARKAASMAAEANATARELENSPEAKDGERAATGQLDEAAKSLRAAEEGLEQAREQGKRGDVREPTAAARKSLQQAADFLQEALQAANGDAREEQQAAAERQQQLEKAAAETAQQLQAAQGSGQATPEQGRRAGARLDEARKKMQEAAQRLAEGQQANAAGTQRDAAEELQKAADELQKGQPPTDAQKEALREQGKRQKELADDILRLAEELKKRQNKNAERAVQQAAESAQRAQRAMENGEPEEAEREQEQARAKLQEAAEQLEEEKDRYQDLRQEELLFRMREELQNFLQAQRPITKETLDAQQASPTEGLSRPVRLKLNQLGKKEQELAGKVQYLVTALADEGNLVYQSVLKANVDDLEEIARRLAGRAPDPGTFTTMLQQDVERRSEELLAALDRERARRDQERREQEQSPGQGQNRLNAARQKLVSLIAELEMLKQLGIDTRRANDNLRVLVEARGDDAPTEAETSMIERLAHRHGEITRLFQQIKAGVESAMKSMQDQEGEEQSGH